MASNSADGPSDNRPVSLVSEDAPAELSVVVDELLNSLSNKFANVSSDIFAKSLSPVKSTTNIACNN